MPGLKVQGTDARGTNGLGKVPKKLWQRNAQGFKV